MINNSASRFLEACHPSMSTGYTHTQLEQHLLQEVKTGTWAARYNTWLLIKLAPKGVVFFLSFLFFSFSFLPRQASGMNGRSNSQAALLRISRCRMILK